MAGVSSNNRRVQGIYSIVRPCVDTAEQVYKLQLGNAQVLLRSAEQIGIVAQQASQRIQESYKELADKLRLLYTSA